MSLDINGYGNFVLLGSLENFRLDQKKAGINPAFFPRAQDPCLVILISVFSKLRIFNQIETNREEKEDPTN